MSGTLAVVSQTGETLNFFDLESGTRTHQLDSLTSEPHELCFDKERNLLYVSHTYRHGHYWVHGDYSHEISIVDINSKKVIDIMDTRPAKGPHGLYMDHARDVLYASVEQLDEHGGGVIGIDLKARKVIKQIPSEYTTHWFIMTPDGKKAYCCNKTASFISVLDLENERMLGKINVPGCEEPSMALDGRYAYFPTPGYKFGKNPSDPKIAVIGTATDEVVDSIELSSGSLPVHVSPLGTILVGQCLHGDKTVGEQDSAQLVLYDGKTHENIGKVPTGLMPLTIRCSVDGKTAFVANAFEGTVSVINLITKVVIKTIDVDLERRKDKPVHVGAHGLAYIP